MLYRMKEAFGATLPLYFSKMLTEFAIYDHDYVKSSVFDLNGLSDETAVAMWNDENFGWKDYNTLVQWLQPILSKQFKNHS